MTHNKTLCEELTQNMKITACATEKYEVTYVYNTYVYNTCTRILFPGYYS